MAAWPSVQGRLLEIRLQQRKTGTKGVPPYYATARYEYRVADVDYQGERFGPHELLNAYRDTDPDRLETKLSRFFTPRNVIARERTDTGLPVWNEKIVILRLQDQPITVYYDPAQPASSLLDPRDPDPATTLGILSPFLGFLSLGLFMTAVSTFLFWLRRASRPKVAPRPTPAVVTHRSRVQGAAPAGATGRERQERAHGAHEASGAGPRQEPVKKLVIAEIRAGGRTVPAGTPLWVFGVTADGRALVEMGGERFEVPADRLVDTPVPAPTDRLLRLDPCFAQPKALRQVYADEANLFRILECPHGSLFLEDTVSGVGWHARLIFIGQAPARRPDLPRLLGAPPPPLRRRAAPARHRHRAVIGLLLVPCPASIVAARELRGC